MSFPTREKLICILDTWDRNFLRKKKKNSFSPSPEKEFQPVILSTRGSDRLLRIINTQASTLHSYEQEYLETTKGNIPFNRTETRCHRTAGRETVEINYFMLKQRERLLLCKESRCRSSTRNPKQSHVSERQ